MNRKNRNRIIDTENVLLGAILEEELGGWDEKDEGIERYKLVVTEFLWGSEVQQREYSSRRLYMHDPWTWTTVWELPEEMGGGQHGGEQRRKNWETIIA